MKKKFLVITIPILIIVGVSVSYRAFRYSQQIIVPNPNFSLKIPDLNILPVEKLSFLLDSLTDPENIGYMQIYTDQLYSREYLTFLNSDINAIYFYDMQTRLPVKIVDLGKYGYDLRFPIQGYHIITPDSIYVYGYKNSHLSLLTLPSGKKIGVTINTRVINQESNVHPLITTRTPILYEHLRQVLYLPGFSSHEGGPASLDRNRHVIAKFSGTTGAVVHGVSYPDVYWGNNWGGGGGLRQAFADLKDDTLLVSFMADHNVYGYDRELNLISVKYMGSSKVSSIRSMAYTNNYHELISSEELYKYYLSTPNYSLIKYDKYNGLIYRVAELPKYFSKHNRLRKKKALIVSTEDFKIQGEWEIPAELVDINHLLVSKRGLLIKSTGTQENRLEFYHYHAPTSTTPSLTGSHYATSNQP